MLEAAFAPRSKLTGTSLPAFVSFRTPSCAASLKFNVRVLGASDSVAFGAGEDDTNLACPKAGPAAIARASNMTRDATSIGDLLVVFSPRRSRQRVGTGPSSAEIPVLVKRRMIAARRPFYGRSLAALDAAVRGGIRLSRRAALADPRADRDRTIGSTRAPRATASSSA